MASLVDIDGVAHDAAGLAAALALVSDRDDAPSRAWLLRAVDAARAAGRRDWLAAAVRQVLARPTPTQRDAIAWLIEHRGVLTLPELLGLLKAPSWQRARLARIRVARAVGLATSRQPAAWTPYLSALATDPAFRDALVPGWLAGDADDFLGRLQDVLGTEPALARQRLLRALAPLPPARRRELAPRLWQEVGGLVPGVRRAVEDLAEDTLPAPPPRVPSTPPRAGPSVAPRVALPLPVDPAGAVRDALAALPWEGEDGVFYEIPAGEALREGHYTIRRGAETRAVDRRVIGAWLIGSRRARALRGAAMDALFAAAAAGVASRLGADPATASAVAALPRVTTDLGLTPFADVEAAAGAPAVPPRTAAALRRLAEVLTEVREGIEGVRPAATPPGLALPDED